MNHSIMSHDEMMRRTWARVTFERQFVCGPICSTEAAYDAVLIIVQKDDKFIVMKNRYVVGEYPVLRSSQEASKYVADFITSTS